MHTYYICYMYYIILYLLHYLYCIILYSVLTMENEKFYAYNSMHISDKTLSQNENV